MNKINAAKKILLKIKDFGLGTVEDELSSQAVSVVKSTIAASGGASLVASSIPLLPVAGGIAGAVVLGLLGRHIYKKYLKKEPDSSEKIAIFTNDIFEKFKAQGCTLETISGEIAKLINDDSVDNSMVLEVLTALKDDPEGLANELGNSQEFLNEFKLLHEEHEEQNRKLDKLLSEADTTNDYFNSLFDQLAGLKEVVVDDGDKTRKAIEEEGEKTRKILEKVIKGGNFEKIIEDLVAGIQLLGDSPSYEEKEKRRKDLINNLAKKYEIPQNKYYELFNQIDQYTKNPKGFSQKYNSLVIKFKFNEAAELAESESIKKEKSFLNALMSAAKARMSCFEHKKAKPHLKKLFRAISNNDKVSKAEVAMLLGRNEFHLSFYNKAEMWLARGLDLLKKTDKSHSLEQEILTASAYLANVYIQQGYINKARDEANKTMIIEKLFSRLNNDKQSDNTLFITAEMLYIFANGECSDDNIKDGFRIFDLLTNHIESIFTLNNKDDSFCEHWYELKIRISIQKVNYLIQADNTEKALSIIEELIEHAKLMVVFYEDSYLSLKSLSTGLISYGDIFYKKLDDPKKALTHYKDALNNRRKITALWENIIENDRNTALCLRKIGNVLYKKLSNFYEALPLYNESLSISNNIKKQIGSTAESEKDIAFSFMGIGNIYSNIGKDHDEVLLYYNNSISIFRTIIKTFGTTSEREKNLADCLTNLNNFTHKFTDQLNLSKIILLGKTSNLSQTISNTANKILNYSIVDDNDLKAKDYSEIDDNKNDPYQLIEYYKEAQTIAINSKAEYGTTRQRLEDIADISTKMADIYFYNLDNIDEALKLYKKSLLIRKEIIITFGETPKSHRDVSISLDNFANVLYYAKDNIDEALKLYKKSLLIRKEIIIKFGETAERARDISISLNRVADVYYYNKGKVDEALKLYKESLDISINIGQKFGETAERARDISISLSRVADVYYYNKDNVDYALELYEESLDISRKIIEKFGGNSSKNK